MKRVIWIILDSVGIGALPDAADFGDEGANTIEHTWKACGGLNIPNLIRLGYGNIDPAGSLPKEKEPIGAYTKAAERSKGKDTTVGHWEMAGIISEQAFPTYPDGFPEEITSRFIQETGVNGILGNKVASGTEIIKELGNEHLATGKPIIYTSADSVFQIAEHVGTDEDCNVTDPDKLKNLYRHCQTARDILRGEHEVSRVIARPFTGPSGKFVRTSDRRDFAILPPRDNLLLRLKEQQYDVIGVGKIEDIFAGLGITQATHTKNNMDGVDVTVRYMKEKNHGLIFTNLVEFDSTWGHRRDPQGYGAGLEEFDARIPEIMEAMTPEDILVINADHGCDPTFRGTDHTREYIPVLLYGASIRPGGFDVRQSFADIGQTIAEYLEAAPIKQGTSFLKEISR